MLKGHPLRSKKETCLQTSELARKISELNRYSTCSPHRSLLWSPCGPPKCPKTDCQICFQQRWISLESAENCNLGSATMMSHVQVPRGKEGRTLIQRGKGIGRAMVKKESMDFQWLSLCLKRRVFLPVIVLCCGHRVWELPFLVSQL